MNSENIILRETNYPPLTNKNDYLDSADFDANFINVYEDLKDLFSANGVDEYNNAVTYDDTVIQYASLDGKLYQWVNPTPGINVTPGTNELYWLEISPSVLAHRKNSDTILAEGTADEVTASEIRMFIDAGLTSTTNLSLSEQTDVSLKINSSTGSDVTLLGATETTAGLLISEDKQKLNQLEGINSGDQTLESLGAEATANKVIDFSVIDNITFPTTEAVANKITSDVVDLVDAQLTNYATTEQLATKENTITAGTTSQYWRGDKSWQTLDKTAVGLGNVVNIDTTNASNLASGIVPTARLGSGTADLTTYLRGDNTWATISTGGLTYFTEAQNSSAPNATINVDSLTAIASTTNADISIVPKGTGAFTLAIPDNTTTGGNKRGLNAVDLQMSRTANTQVASGNYSFNAGQNNISSGLGSNAIGIGNTASAENAICLGKSNSAISETAIALGISNTASGYRSVSIGVLNSSTSSTSYCFGNGNTANRAGAVAIGTSCTSAGDGAVAIGNSVNTFLQHNRISFSSGSIGPSGDIQKSFYILKGRTTNATPKTLTSDNGGVTTASIMVLQNNNVIRFKGSIVGKQTGTTNIAVWDIDGVIVRGANAAATTLTISNVNLVTNASSWGTPTLTADTTLGGLTINATGLAATNIQWIADVQTSEVIY